MIDTGERVPEAVVVLEDRKAVKLRDLLADGPALLVFYLFDWSSTWTDELLLLRDRSREFEQAGVRVFGISRDSPWTHIAWKQALDLDLPLLSDWNGDATESFGLAREFIGFQGIPERSAFLIDGEGIVRGAWRYDDSEVPDLDPILSMAREL
jgi:peroxiredoxin